MLFPQGGQWLQADLWAYPPAHRVWAVLGAAEKMRDPARRVGRVHWPASQAVTRCDQSSLGPQGSPPLLLDQGCVPAGERHLCFVRRVKVKVILDIKVFSVTVSCNFSVLLPGCKKDWFKICYTHNENLHATKLHQSLDPPDCLFVLLPAPPHSLSDPRVILGNVNVSK